MGFGGVPCQPRTPPIIPSGRPRRLRPWSGWCGGPPASSGWSSGPSSRCCCTPTRRWATRRRASSWVNIPIGSASGANGGPWTASPWPRWRTAPGRDAPRGFPPLAQATVKAIACELPTPRAQPLSRYSLADLQQVVAQDPAVGLLSRSTLWRLLAQDALQPWRYRMWIFPRDPAFVEKAGRVLDLYAGWWLGPRLGPHDYVLSADEKTSIQARERCHPSRPPGPGYLQQIEFEYERRGAVQHLAAWAVRRALVCGRCEAQTGIEPFGPLVAPVIGQEPYHTAHRGFWIVDNGSSHRGQAAVERLQSPYPNLILVHLPLHASWLNQIEIYFSIIQRKVLTPHDFPNCAAVAERLAAFETRWNAYPKPFAWRFTRADLERRLREHDAAPVLSTAA